MARSTRRIYYGPPGAETAMFWTIRTRLATSTVIVNGTAMDALKAHRGVTVGCAISLAGMENRKAFPHNALLISVTKSTALVVDKLNKQGQPCSGVLYAHSYGKWVDDNDTGKLKRMVADNPALMERPFTLRPPRKRGGGGTGTATGSKAHEASRKLFIPRGALGRARKAGLISGPVAEQLSRAIREGRQHTEPKQDPPTSDQ